MLCVSSTKCERVLTGIHILMLSTIDVFLIVLVNITKKELLKTDGQYAYVLFE